MRIADTCVRVLSRVCLWRRRPVSFTFDGTSGDAPVPDITFDGMGARAASDILLPCILVGGNTLSAVSRCVPDAETSARAYTGFQLAPLTHLHHFFCFCLRRPRV